MSEEQAILKGIYPIISSSLSKNTTKFKKLIARFIEKRSTELFDTAPCSRIPFLKDDVDEFYKTLNIKESDIEKELAKTYYWNIANFNPRAAKDPVSVALLNCVRYFFIKKDKKNTELAMIYLAFSGKFYPSIHYGSYQIATPEKNRYVMDYVINEKLTNKFDIKREGSVFGAVKSIANTWLTTYDDKLQSFTDEDVVYLIQQLHNRIRSFTVNIAKVFYDVYANKDNYFTYNSDSLDEDNYHIADNDSLKIERLVENTMSYISSNGVDYRICKMASDSNVKTDELKEIIEAIISDNINLSEAKELIRLIITQYFIESKNKDVRDINFINKSVAAKPNTKDKNILRQKEIIENWLENNSTAYRRRKSRIATKNSYFKSVLMYFVLLIHISNK